MRPPRKFILGFKSSAHFIWKCINSEFLLDPELAKRRFLDGLVKFRKRAEGKVQLHSFCVMGNHVHQSVTLLDGPEYLSNWARSVHSSFCRWYNLRNGRHGPVGQARPHTVAVQDQESLKRVMFYGDWNPVRAGMCDHPSEYRYSSYRFYAYGETNSWTEILTPPQWYLDLGKTPEQRQKKYRRLCDQYQADKRIPEKAEAEAKYAFGKEKFVKQRNELIAEALSHLRERKVPRERLDAWMKEHLAKPRPAAKRAPP